MARDNGHCGVGVAYDCRIGGEPYNICQLRYSHSQSLFCCASFPFSIPSLYSAAPCSHSPFYSRIETGNESNVNQQTPKSVLQHVLLSFAGIKMSVEESTDVSEANALGFQGNYIDIYSNSWGPSDLGFIVQGPGHLAQMALQTAVREVGARDTMQ